ncbi:glycoside hydrolase family 2 TIM barrel-domain containing protein [Alkalihalobacillus hemicellulosilyticus]|uniref:Beta-galactosidase n=1 Tax=Halalkalibacter hemicellulosilyticusJCM 9152 TaxID=1236971 RepID=W4QCE9_9BACI|nr:glycoside hydrolase family 2 TIM barrel-domain containing protein [Halalkalibacter hemicellulosilyticus]GAE29353.1 beta-galactosidase [Halalkalibacter hemicellulosilyticusJCM 9152]
MTKKYNVNLDWKFLLGEEKNAWYKGFDDRHWRDVQLPHDWSVEAPFSKEHSSGTGYLPGGIGWYRKSFHLQEEIKGKKVNLTIEGAYQNAKVWVNSYYLGYRPYGYSSFSYDISDFVHSGDNVLSIRLDRPSTSDSRWFTGSGIYRNVYVSVQEHTRIVPESTFYYTKSSDENNAVVAVETTIENDTVYKKKLKIESVLYDDHDHIQGELSQLVTLQANDAQQLSFELNIDSPQLWSPETPHLYQLVTRVSEADELVDELVTTVGIRSISFDYETGFFLNGKSTLLKGVCVHHDAGTLGAAVPKEVWKRRLEKFKDLGANAIRMSHNPPAPDLLDLCDEMGFLVIDEIFDEWEGPKNKWSTGHNVYPPKHDGYFEHFPEWGERDLKDWVQRDRNHPSIIAWSIGNEIDYPNDPYCHPSFKEMTGNNDKDKPVQERQYDPNKPNAERLVSISKKLVNYVKEIDTTRPVTAALAYPELSNLTGLSDTLDIVGYNYKEHLYEQDHNKYTGQVIYGSENSHSVDNWLEVVNRPYISGQFLWTGIDFLGEAQGWPIRGSMAGLLDLAGREKPGFYLRKSLWSKELFGKMTVEQMDSHKELFMWDYDEGDQVLIRGYTNGEKAECFVNGKSLGVKEVTNIGEVPVWQTTFQKGEIKLVVVNDDHESFEDVLYTPSHDHYLLKAISDKDTLVGNGEDVAHIEVYLTDQEGKMVINDQERIEVSTEGAIDILGIENGDLSDLTPYSASQRNFHQGYVLIYVRSKTEGGEAAIHIRNTGAKDTKVPFTIV